MIKVQLLKDHNENKTGDIISVSNNVAFGLEEKGIAKRVVGEEVMQKTEFGKTKALSKPPSKTVVKKKIN